MRRVESPQQKAENHDHFESSASGGCRWGLERTYSVPRAENRAVSTSRFEEMATGLPSLRGLPSLFPGFLKDHFGEYLLCF
jgi:hypothetical protein